MTKTGVNNLSQQLCELCGIEPRPVLDKNKQTLVVDKLAFVYPDFENPENFVKLEEIMLKELAKERLTVVKWVHEWSDSILMHEYIMITKCGHKFQFKHKDLYIDNWFVERENRTDCLILFILWKVMPICGEAIKQAIAAEEWEY